MLFNALLFTVLGLRTRAHNLLFLNILVSQALFSHSHSTSPLTQQAGTRLYVGLYLRGCGRYTYVLVLRAHTHIAHATHSNALTLSATRALACTYSGASPPLPARQRAPRPRHTRCRPPFPQEALLLPPFTYSTPTSTPHHAPQPHCTLLAHTRGYCYAGQANVHVNHIGTRLAPDNPVRGRPCLRPLEGCLSSHFLP